MFKLLYYFFWFVIFKVQRTECFFNSIICISEGSSYQQIFENLKQAYRLGARNIRFDGESLIWNNDNKTFENVVEIARKIGFISISVFWDIKEELKTSVKNIWIELGAMYETDTESWQACTQKLANIKNKHLYSIFTIKKTNYTYVEDVVKFVAGNPKIKAIGFVFCDDKGNESDSLNDELKFFIIDKILDLKKKAFPILNSYSELISAKNETEKKQNFVIVFDDNGLKKQVDCYSELNPIIGEFE